MTFVQFLLLFLVAPAALLLVAHGPAQLRTTVAVVAVVALLMLLLTAPLAVVLVRADVLVYRPDGVAGTLASVPGEAIALAGLEAAFSGALTTLVLRRRWWNG